MRYQVHRTEPTVLDPGAWADYHDPDVSLEEAAARIACSAFRPGDTKLLIFIAGSATYPSGNPMTADVYSVVRSVKVDGDARLQTDGYIRHRHVTGEPD